MASITPTTEIAWMAGIFDGEGSARIYKTKGTHYFAQVAAITGTDFQMAERVISILDRLDIKYYFRKDNGNWKRKAHFSKCFDIRIATKIGMQTYLSTILPYTTGLKKHQAELVLSFIRLSNRPNPGKAGKSSESVANDEALYSSQSFRPRPGVSTN